MHCIRPNDQSISRLLIKLVLIAAIIGLMVPCAVPALAEGAAAKPPSESWLGLYIGGQKMGYMHLSTDRTTYEGRECARVQSFVRTKMLLLGANVQQDVRTVVYADDHFTPYFESVDMSSGGRKTVIEATFGPTEVKCTVISADGKSESVAPIPAGASLVGDPMYALGADKLKIGQKAKMHYFNPLKLSVDPSEVEVLRKEQVDVKGTVYDTFVVKNVTPMGDVTTWQTENGAIVKAITLMGLTMQIETAQDAISGIDSGYTPPADLAVITSVKANIDLPNPQSIKKLTIKLRGNMEPRMGISDNRQKIKWLEPVDGNRVAEFTIESTKFNKKKSAKLPIPGEDVAKYLKPTAYLQCDNPDIKSRADEIVGSEKSAYNAASKIRGWVSKNMRAQADIGIVRPSVDVLRAKVGVCRDYAVLYAALARAAGIPTKVVSGLVYMNGNFYYHAWAESYVGEWIAFDATLQSDFVDATHIKLTEGDATDMFQMSRIFGNLKAEIVKYE